MVTTEIDIPVGMTLNDVHYFLRNMPEELRPSVVTLNFPNNKTLSLRPESTLLEWIKEVSNFCEKEGIPNAMEMIFGKNS